MSAFSEWLSESLEVGTRHTRNLPPSSRRERLHFKLFGVNPQSVVDRRMEALMLDEVERRRWLRENPPPLGGRTDERA